MSTGERIQSTADPQAQADTRDGTFEAWSLVEIMGHKRFAGLVTEQTLGGASFVRVDVPQTKSSAAFTKLFGASSIYCITPISEAAARKLAEQLGERPVHIYEPPMITHQRDEDFADGLDDFDDEDEEIG